MTSRITTNPDVMGGQPCVRGLRVTAATVQEYLGAGVPDSEILALYPYLTPEDLDAVRAWYREQRVWERETAG
ncbi:MAG: DUF433 domain-containing protein [Fimbriimonadaceae bacterium]|nr:DUF433 domain-containing protein [Fimbriimonadaceae bacterium]